MSGGRCPHERNHMENEINVAANEPEVATPNPDVVTTPEVQGQDDITQTQAFAHRLADATTKAEQRARDNLISEMYGESHGINTYAEYQQELDNQAMRERGVDPDEVKRVAEDLPEVKTAREAKRQYEMYLEMTEEYPEYKNMDKIPVEIFEISKKRNISYLAAAEIHEAKVLKAEKAELAKGTKAKQANEETAKGATGSVASGGTPNLTTFTREQVQAMSFDEAKINHKQIMESMKTWK